MTKKKIIMHSVILSCIYGSMGCVSYQYFSEKNSYNIDASEFSDEQIEDILEVCEEYNSLLGDYHLNCVLKDSSYNVIRSYKSRPEYACGAETLGCAVSEIAITGAIIRHDVYINTSKSEYDFKTVVRHEIGHTLGLDHTKSGVMQSHLQKRAEYFIDNEMIQKIKESNGW